MEFCRNKNCNQSFIPSEDAVYTHLGYCSHECNVLDVGIIVEHKVKPATALQQLHTLEDLHEARCNKRAIITTVGPWSRKPTPAACLINLQGSLLVKLFRSGVWIYEKK